MQRDAPAPKITEVLPKAGLVYSEKGNLGEVLSKPKIMPLKSITLQRLEEMEKAAATVSETMASVLRDEVDWDSLPPETPPSVVQLLRRCFDRNPKMRLRDIGEARVALSPEALLGAACWGLLVHRFGGAPLASETQDLLASFARRPVLAGEPVDEQGEQGEGTHRPQSR